MLRIPRQLHNKHYIEHIRYLHSAYIINPTTRCLEQEQQACYLTKTVFQHQLPTTTTEVSHNDRLHIQESVKQCVVNVNHFHQQDKPYLRKRLHPNLKQRALDKWRNELSHQIIINMLRVVESTPGAEGVGSNSLTYGSEIIAPWERLGKKIQISGRLGHLVSGKKLLPLFADKEEVESTRGIDVSWVDLISPFFDLHEYETHFTPESGFHPGSPFPCPQTLIAINPLKNKSHHNTGLAVFYTFAHALNYALANGEQMGKELVNPVPMQCMVFNGMTFDFVCYQLNTLDFSEDNTGLKNMAWICGQQQLYNKVTEESFEVVDEKEGEESSIPALPSIGEFQEFSSKRASLTEYNRRKLSKTVPDEKLVRLCVDGFNREAVDLFTDFVLRPCTGGANEQIDDDSQIHASV